MTKTYMSEYCSRVLPVLPVVPLFIVNICAHADVDGWRVDRLDMYSYHACTMHAYVRVHVRTYTYVYNNDRS